MSVKKDLGFAVALFERACKLDRSSCFRLGILYQQGEGVTKDEKRAKELYDKTCAARTDSLSTLFCHLSAVLYGGKREGRSGAGGRSAEPAFARRRVQTHFSPARRIRVAPGRRLCPRPGPSSRASASTVGGTGLGQRACR